VAEVRAYFAMLSTWLAAVLDNGCKQGTFTLNDPAEAEAEKFMAAVHGAMLSARAYGDGKVFALVTEPLLDGLTARR
jgi:TetR/AcrR family transcriptional repressor of nem operon